jgi:integrase
MIGFLFRPSRGGKKSKLWSAKVRLDGWAKLRVFPLHVTDKRVAQHKLEEIVQEHERESVGIIAPREMRSAAQKPLAEHLEAFLADVVAKQRSPNTVKAYRRALGKLFLRCRWRYLRDVTPRSFVDWRSLNEVSPKYANDLLGYTGSLLNWLVRQGQLLANPLREVEKVTIKRDRGYRRAMSIEQIERLLSVVPLHRATIYLMAMYTGLRRHELNGLTWGDFVLDGETPFVRVPDSISKNAKSATLGLRPELVAALVSYRPALTQPFEWAFRGRVPNIDTFYRDLDRAKISRLDEYGRRLDFHALRTTFGTHLQASGVSMRAAMELMRHSDSKLTMRVYTDARHLPLVTELARLPSFGVPTSTPAVKSSAANLL